MDFTRQRAFFDPDKVDSAVTVVGCGGVGSFAALALAKLGINQINLIDPDTVEEHNVPNQMFGVEQIGATKVSATKVNILEFADPSGVDVYQERLQDVDDRLFRVPVVVSALDSMEARADLWGRLKYKLAPRLLVDARLAGEYVVLYTARPAVSSDVEGYEKTLHSDEEALEVSCTARSIIDVGFVVASLITRAVRKHLTDQDVERQIFLNQSDLTLLKGGFS